MLKGLLTKHIFDEAYEFRLQLPLLSKNPELAGKAVVFCQGNIEVVCDSPEEAYLEGVSLLGMDTPWVVGEINPLELRRIA